MVLGAQVLDRHGDRGTLLLAGVRLQAAAAAELAAGDALRVRVQEATTEQLSAEGRPAGLRRSRRPTQASRAYALALPGGAQAAPGRARRGGGEDGRGGGGRRSVTLRYDSPALGRIDFVIDLEAAAVARAVHVSAGAPAALAGRRRRAASAR